MNATNATNIVTFSLTIDLQNQPFSGPHPTEAHIFRRDADANYEGIIYTPDRYHDNSPHLDFPQLPSLFASLLEVTRLRCTQVFREDTSSVLMNNKRFMSN